MAPTRRLVLGAGALALLPRGVRAEGTSGVPAVPPAAGDETPERHGERHGMSSFGELRYPADFARFAYVNPEAPRGGRFASLLSQTFGNQAFGTFNTLNPYVLRGDGAAGINLTFDSLMVRALDEPDAVYGLVARSVAVSADGLTYTFRLRPQARFHDGTRLTAHDAAFSLTTLRDHGHPAISQEIRDMSEAAAEDDGVLVVRFNPGRARDLPLTVAQLPIFSRAWWGTRDFEASTMEPILGSGPYRVARVDAGRAIGLERVADYWAADLPVSVGQHNFDEIRFEYFRDRNVAMEAFKGRAYTFREEFVARLWANAYDFPAVAEGRVRRFTVPDRRPSGTQGWWLNTRRPQFRDPKIREAVNLCLDFPWMNKNLMFGAYTRTVSFFENSDLKAEGPPAPDEMALLEPLRDRLPAEVFGEPWSPPVADGSGQDRVLLRRADALLREAGCTRANGGLLLPDGKPFTIEFLDFDPSLEPHTQAFIRNLGLVGIRAAIRNVDPSQYQARVNDFDFDVVSRRFSSGPTPGPELRQMYGARAAGVKGSNNLAGISDPAVDALLDKVAGATSREALRHAARALDRVLRAGRYWVPMWYSGVHRLAVWEGFGRPETGPDYDLGAPATWWSEPGRGTNR
ncbi:extracellular solute-binding protein [Methylobacterium gregans]|uniref:Oligopeptide-binding protein AppA n=1 Tax=Methylobacterium gregans TaxID=374424 RepID=A0AA37MBU6_9HYPH|nr:extracellular solute-binding protein [Methylobacterium gregans]MDQ0519192.1 microcin C transport system substrate-binding protein [Methylobacterium gregans]GJD78796.1 Oligopeptide-binding protein AppA [Methylobacterium gregans]GLS53633.1 ABC transporter substrate-binding protein [Methylobacterium gregans]